MLVALLEQHTVIKSEMLFAERYVKAGVSNAETKELQVIPVSQERAEL